MERDDAEKVRRIGIIVGQSLQQAERLILALQLSHDPSVTIVDEKQRHSESLPHFARAQPRTCRTAIISADVDQLMAIGTYPTRDEAEVVQGLLQAAGIEASLRADDAGGTFPFVLSGGAQVLVDESDAAAASELLASSTES